MTYRVTDAPDLPTPVVTFMGPYPAVVSLRGPGLADVADAILEHHSGQRWPLSDVLTFAVMTFGTAMRSTLDVEVRTSQVARFIDAARRVA